MTSSAVYAPGKKTHRDENFPVASYVIAKRYRAPVLAFYNFARAADDIADHPELTAQEKITQLNCFENTLLGHDNVIAEAAVLRNVLGKRGLTSRHALDLLIAFRQDAIQSRYKNWDDLLRYCSYSAAPVGRFVLDVHGESPSLWPASDILCAILQIINHLQDCKADYQRLNRVYIPEGALVFYGLDETALIAPCASGQLRSCLNELVKKTQLLMNSAHFALQVKNMRLAMEVATIERIAEKLLYILHARDPLCEHVHLNKTQLAFTMLHSAIFTLAGKTFRRTA